VIATMDGDESLESSGSRRTRSGMAIIRMIFNTLGQTGTTILVLIISLVFAYITYTRYMNPATKVSYVKK
ncbi:MAG: hypothetical protein AAFO94_03535, partial [Bacteroidota bacterium]